MWLMLDNYNNNQPLNGTIAGLLYILLVDMNKKRK